MQAGREELAEKEQELKDGWSEYYREKAEAEQQIADGEEELSQAEADIAKAEHELGLLEDPQWYVLDRNGVQAYVEYNQDADRIGAVGEVFPAIFFLVAALVSLTTMTLNRQHFGRACRGVPPPAGDLKRLRHALSEPAGAPDAA